MNDHEPTPSSPILEKPSGSFEVTVTEESLLQWSHNTCEIHGVQKLRRGFDETEKLINTLKEARCRWVVPCVLGIALTGPVMWATFRTNGFLENVAGFGCLFVFVAGLLLSFLVLLLRRVTVPLAKWVLRFSARRDKRTVERSYKIYRNQIPYTIKYQIGDTSWKSVSEPGGEKSVELKPRMIVLHNRCLYSLYESDLSDNWLFSLFADTGPQRSLIEENLAANGIPCHRIDEFDIDLDKFAK